MRFGVFFGLGYLITCYMWYRVGQIKQEGLTLRATGHLLHVLLNKIMKAKSMEEVTQFEAQAWTDWTAAITDDKKLKQYAELYIQERKERQLHATNPRAASDFNQT